jgi:hypothetical protein
LVVGQVGVRRVSARTLATDTQAAALASSLSLAAGAGGIRDFGAARAQERKCAYEGEQRRESHGFGPFEQVKSPDEVVGLVYPC